MKKTKNSTVFVGEMVEAVYEAALEEYMDEILAKRIAMQFLLRKLRMHDKDQQGQKKDQIESLKRP